MTPTELRATLDRLGLSQAVLARMVDTERQAVWRWLLDPAHANARATPHWLPSWLAMFERLTPEQRLEIWPS